MRSGAMSDAKRRNGQRLALGLAGLAAVWLVGVWPPPLWWRSHWPRCTAMMRLRGTAVSYQPSALNRISPLLQRMVIIGEDSRFRTHHGIDVAEIADAVDPGGGGGREVVGGAGLAVRRAAGGAPRGPAPPPAPLHPRFPPGAHAGAGGPDPGALPRRARVHPAGGGARFALCDPGDSAAGHPAAPRYAAGFAGNGYGSGEERPYQKGQYVGPSVVLYPNRRVGAASPAPCSSPGRPIPPARPV